MFHGRDAPLAYRNGSRRSRSMQGLAIRAALIFVSSGSRRYRRAHRSAQSSHRRPKRMSYERVGGALLVCLGGDHATEIPGAAGERQAKERKGRVRVVPNCGVNFRRWNARSSLQVPFIRTTPLSSRLVAEQTRHSIEGRPNREDRGRRRTASSDLPTRKAGLCSLCMIGIL